MRDKEFKKRFNTRGDDGQEYVLVYTVKMLSRHTAANPDGEDPGVESFTTSDGLDVEKLEKGSYRIVETGVILEYPHPDAP